MRGRVLALDCSLRLTGVALGEEGREVASEALDLGRRQAAELPLMVARLLEGAGWSVRDLDLVAVTSGPGYFTGIRVGAAYAAALAFGLGVGLVPIPSLEMLALSCPDCTASLALVYAGRGFVYAASHGVPEGCPAGEYGGEFVAEWMARHPGVQAISDDPQRAARAADLTFPIRAVRPDVRVLTGAAWARRDRAIDPKDLKVAYCRAPQGTE